MTDEDPINDDEIDETDVGGDDDIDDDVADSDDVIDSDEVAFKPSKKKAAESEALEDFSIASRQKARAELEDQVAAFLARGGKINEVQANVTSDPPKKPTPDYGGRPI